MPLRTLFRYLANNERLVQKLSESYPVRRAAQMVVSIMYKGKMKVAEMDPKDVSKFMAFLQKFRVNLKDGIEEARRKLKK